MNIPLDELVNDKIGMDNFFSRLTRREKDFVARKLEGWSNKQIMEGLRISYSRLKEMMEDIRFKIELAFA
jgi:FixJ family two-component response regulator